MKEISLREEISINRYTPIDWAREKISFMNCHIGLWEHKVLDYERLLKALEKGYDERIFSNYMDNICGRIQVRHAMDRGLITKEQYNNLKIKHPLRVSNHI